MARRRRKYRSYARSAGGYIRRAGRSRRQGFFTKQTMDGAIAAGAGILVPKFLNFPFARQAAIGSYGLIRNNKTLMGFALGEAAATFLLGGMGNGSMGGNGQGWL